MRISKGLALGLLGALVVGGVEAVGGMGVQAVAGSDASAVSITVPFSSLGDRVLYVASWRANETDPWKPGQRTSFEVATVDAVPDKHGTLHEVLHVYLNNWSFQEQGGILGNEWRNEGHGFEDRSYAVADRTAVFVHYRAEITTDYRFVNRAENHDALGVYGPFDMGFVPGLPSNAVVKWDLALHQGRTYDDTANLGMWPAERLAAEEGLAWTPDTVARLLEFEGRTGEPAMIDERLSLPLSLTGCVEWIQGPTPIPWYGGPPFLGFEMRPPQRVCFEYTEWVAADVPYPVRIESRLMVNGTERLERIDELAAYVPGTEAIPWGHGASPIPAPRPARSPANQHFPADGSAPLPYPLSDALTAVEEDAGLLQFKIWRVQHPDAILVGAALRPTQSDPSQLQWDLVYGTQDGRGYVVSTQRTAAGGRVTNLQMGEMPTPKYESEELIRGPVTFGAAAALWERYSLEAPKKPGVSYVSWGYQYSPSTLRCIHTDQCGATPHGVRAPPMGLATIAYGQSARATGPAMAAEEPLWDPFNFIVVDARDGTVPVSFLAAPEYGFVPLGAPAGSGGQPATPQALPARPFAPDVAAGATISASLILLLLSAYFYPVLKFAVTQAGFLIPGYAKTEKSQLLNHKLRETLMNAIRQDPGVTPPQLHALSGLAWSTVVYHLRQLEKNKLVTSLIDGRHKRFFPADDVNWNQRDRIAALANVRTKQLYGLLLEEPGLDRHDLARRIGISRPATYFHLDRLERTGLVGRDTEGRRTRFFALQGPEVTPPFDPRDAIEVA